MFTSLLQGRLRLALLAAAIATAPAFAQDDLPPLRIRASNTYPQSEPTGKTMDFFAERVAQLSGKKITVQVYHGGKLYVEDKSIQAVLDGTIEMGMASAGNHGPFTKVWQVVETPFLLDRKQLREVVIRGEIGKELKKMAERDGLRPIMILEGGGHRTLGAHQVVKVPADMKNMKVRAPSSPVIMAFYRGLGANPTVVPAGEMYLALASKTVDAVDTNLAGYPTFKLWEVLKYATTINWSPVASVIDVNVKWWNERTPKQRAIIEQAAREAEEFSMKAEDENEIALRALLKKNGMVVYDPTPEEREVWRKAGLAIWKDLPDLDPAFLQRIDRAAKAVK